MQVNEFRRNFRIRTGTGNSNLALRSIGYIGSLLRSILTDDATVLDVAQVYQPWTLLFPLCGMAAFIWDGIYIGATATKGMLISMASGMVMFFLLYFTLVPVWGNHGLWIAFVIYLATRGITQTIMRKKIWKA